MSSIVASKMPAVIELLQAFHHLALLFIPEFELTCVAQIILNEVSSLMFFEQFLSAEELSAPIN